MAIKRGTRTARNSDYLCPIYLVKRRQEIMDKEVLTYLKEARNEHLGRCGIRI